ncbi:hypothetical protein Lal_00039745 [Lupinus albus]|nr:hypothetical protein Lal_00039745 [Lupinus albus]
MFRMRPGHKILDLQRRFTNLTNHLVALGKVLLNSDLNLKVLRSLTRTWQPKEDELELSQLDQHEEQEKKKKNISLKEKIEKYDSSEDEDDKEETDDMSLFNFTCFECGKPGHIKMDCSNIKKSSFKGKNELKNGRRAYIAWEDYDTSSASEHESEEQAHLSLMASHHSDDEEGDLRATRNLWYLHSGCSKHMTSEKSKFSVLTPRDKGYVTYGDNNKGRILGVGRISKPPSTTIEGVLYVEGLKHNLLSIRHLCHTC